MSQNYVNKGDIQLNLYFKIKLIGDLFIIGMVILIVLVFFIKDFIRSYKLNKIKEFLLSIGYKRELISTAAFGTNHTYGYRREGDIIRDYELNGMSLNQIKEKYK